jgi:hypothetical protein
VTTIDSVAEDAHLFVIPAAGGAGKEVATDQDRRVRNPNWSPDGRSLIYLAGDRGYTNLFQTSIDGGSVSRFSLFVLDIQMAGAFATQDPKWSAYQPLIQPFQITNFSVGSRSVTTVRGNVTEVTFPFVMTMGNALRPSEVWAGRRQPFPFAPFERAQRLADAILASLFSRGVHFPKL